MACPQPLWLIDGHNLLHTLGEFARSRELDIAAAQDSLMSRLEAVRGGVWCFFDGGPGGQAHTRRCGQRLWRVDAGARSADDAIITWLQRHPGHRPASVVSADRDLGLRARAQTAKIIDPVAFWRRHVPTRARSAQQAVSEQHRSLSDGEVAEWLRYFGAEDEES